MSPRLTVAIPAKNERESIVRALRAFGVQRALDGGPVDRGLFEIVVFANDCDDDTAAAARRFSREAPEIAVTVVAETLPRLTAHVGTARRRALDIAAGRQVRANGPAGIIASTDADSVVDPHWVTQTLREIRDVDAVAGHVEVSTFERERMPAPLRLLYDRERTYRRVLGDMESYVDPRPFDPPSRHDSLVGTSFAVRVGTYLTAGRLPPLPRLEDVAFAKALRRIDARVRHSYAVRVETSARVHARVDGGFASMLVDLHGRGLRRESFNVENAARSIAKARSRALLRALWHGPAERTVVDELCAIAELSESELRYLVDSGSAFGETLERFESTMPPFDELVDEPVEAATAALRDALSNAIAASATRINAASGAG